MTEIALSSESSTQNVSKKISIPTQYTPLTFILNISLDVLYKPQTINLSILCSYDRAS